MIQPLSPASTNTSALYFVPTRPYDILLRRYVGTRVTKPRNFHVPPISTIQSRYSKHFNLVAGNLQEFSFYLTLAKLLDIQTRFIHNKNPKEETKTSVGKENNQVDLGRTFFYED